MGDYFRHWIAMQHSLSDTPRIFRVNWFRKDEQGKFLWPGFAQNLRILHWIIDRVHGHALGRETPIGWMPRYDDIDWTGLDYPREKFDRLQTLDREAWHAEVIEHEDWLMGLYDHLPPEMIYQRELLVCRLQAARPAATVAE
jgi:phosphoenolpyruvate carboxykinase (GTP)